MIRFVHFLKFTLKSFFSHFQAHRIHIQMHISSARSLRVHPKALLGFSSSMLVTGFLKALILILLLSCFNSIYNIFMYIFSGTTWSTSTGTYWNLGLSSVFLVTVRVTVGVVHCRYFLKTFFLHYLGTSLLSIIFSVIKMKNFVMVFKIWQIWRMSGLIYRPEDEVLAELENFKSQVFSCASRPWWSKSRDCLSTLLWFRRCRQFFADENLFYVCGLSINFSEESLGICRPVIQKYW